MAMNGLGMILHGGAEGVPADARRAIQLYQRAIREREHVPAMTNLATLLHGGADAVPINAKRAVELYERAVRERHEVEAVNVARITTMYTLGTLLQSGAEGVPADAQRAVQPYEHAMREGNHVPAMYPLGLLLMNGASGVAVNTTRAVDLICRASQIDSVGDMLVIAFAHGTGQLWMCARRWSDVQSAVEKHQEMVWTLCRHYGRVPRTGFMGFERDLDLSDGIQEYATSRAQRDRLRAAHRFPSVSAP
eukprot:TRINITY_DN1578_c0_g1_i1.p1 TRINITY_DN1578_c0_g1~~TRINITY_DN1578_c0_g1_i1.p1  ORF type:complete len:249 (-),score=28.31 TRINITY_DN1578_c0_g1_i1:998-1744(-)